MAWNPAYLDEYEAEMRAKRESRALAEERADNENEIGRLRRRCDTLKAACQTVLDRLRKYEMDFESQQILDSAIKGFWRPKAKAERS